MQLEPGIHETGRHFFSAANLEFSDNSIVYWMNPKDKTALHPGRWLSSTVRDLECVKANRVANAAIAKAMQ